MENRTEQLRSFLELTTGSGRLDELIEALAGLAEAVAAEPPTQRRMSLPH